MRAYLATLQARFRVLLQYRAAALSGVVTQLFWGVIRIMILEAFYRRSGGAGAPMSFGQAAVYVWLGQAFLGMLPWSVDGDLRAMIRRGDVVCELTRPVDLYWNWYVRAVAQRSAPTLLRCIPISIVAGLLLHLTPLAGWSLQGPAGVAAFGAFAATMVGALLLAAAITAVLHISLLWSLGSEGVSILVLAGGTLLTGLVVPLPLFPDWLVAYLQYSPFAFLGDVPFRLYCGQIPAERVGWLLLVEAGWVVVLVVFGRRLLNQGLRRLVIQGG
jgi:ABC-2 type transport system permease protein